GRLFLCLPAMENKTPVATGCPTTLLLRWALAVMAAAKAECKTTPKVEVVCWVSHLPKHPKPHLCKVRYTGDHIRCCSIFHPWGNHCRWRRTLRTPRIHCSAGTRLVLLQI